MDGCFEHVCSGQCMFDLNHISQLYASCVRGDRQETDEVGQSRVDCEA